MWQYLNTPSAFDGREADRIEKVADDLAELGLYTQAERLRIIADDIRPLLTWYGEAANQAAHGFMGVWLTVVFCAVWREVAGEMPVKSWAFAALFLPYAIGAQVVLQYLVRKAKGQRTTPLSDAVFDSLMYGIAAAGALIPFSEAGTEGNLTAVLYDHRAMLIICIAWVWLYAARVLPRYIDADPRQY